MTGFRFLILIVNFVGIQATAFHSSAEAGVLVPIPPVKGSVGTYISVINNNNVIAGVYYTSDRMGHGFIGTLDGKYKKFDAHGGYAFPTGIDDNENLLVSTKDQKCTFGCEYLRTSNGKLKPITRDGTQLGGFTGQIINGLKFVGNYLDKNFDYQPYYGRGTKYRSPLNLPLNATQISPQGYNSSGTVVGVFSDSDQGDAPAFVVEDGAAKAVRYPDSSAFFTYLNNLNSKGIAAGYWADETLSSYHAFLYDTKKDAFLPIEAEGLSSVIASGINDAGIAAVQVNGTSYIYCPKKRNCPISSPREIQTRNQWISSRS